MKQFYKDFGFIIGFMTGTLVIGMVFGDKVQYYFLILVLLSMLIMNSTDFINFVDDKMSLKTADEL